MKQRSSTCGEFHAGDGLKMRSFGSEKDEVGVGGCEFECGAEESDLD
jgi:hypothetical protein